METELKENERIDDLERNGYRIIQNKSRFCFGMDAVLLSGFAWEGEGSCTGKKLRIADLGTGTGIIPLLLHGRMAKARPETGQSSGTCAQNNTLAAVPEDRSGTEPADGSDPVQPDASGAGLTERSAAVPGTSGQPFIYGLEIQKEMAQMAQRSVELNGLEQDIVILNADLRGASELLGKSCFDVVASNPPYMKHGGGLKNPDDSKAISRHEIMCTFNDVAREAAQLMKTGGRFYLVHRPERLADLIRTLSRYHLEPKRLRMVHSFEDTEAVMVLIESRKNAGCFMKVEKPLIIYQSKGVYTDEIREIYGY